MINKVLRSSRAFPLGSVGSFYDVRSPSGARMLFFVKITCEVFDVLVFLQDSSYLCRYKFPRFSWFEEDVIDYLTKNV